MVAEALGDVGLAHEAPDAAVLSRGDLFAFAEPATESVEGARRLLWACLSWGTGQRHRHNRQRIDSIARDPQHVGALLRQAAQTARHDAREAYELLRPGKSEIPFLGPPLFTKFVYAAGGGTPDHPKGIPTGRMM